MKKAIRIEHEDGYGMFSHSGKDYSKNTLEELCPEAWGRHADLPTPRSLGYAISPYEFCAYESMGEMVKWLKPGEIGILLESGYRVLELHLEKFVEMGGQAFYFKESILEEIDISDLFR